LLVLTISSCRVEPTGDDGGGSGGDSGGSGTTTYVVYAGYMSYDDYGFTLNVGNIHAKYDSSSSDYVYYGTYHSWTRSEIENYLISNGAGSSQASEYTTYLLSSFYNLVALRPYSLVYFVYKPY